MGKDVETCVKRSETRVLLTGNMTTFVSHHTLDMTMMNARTGQVIMIIGSNLQ